MEIIALFSAALLIVLSLAFPQMKMRPQVVRKSQSPRDPKSRYQ